MCAALLFTGCGIPLGEYIYQFTGADWFLNEEKIIEQDSKFFPTTGYAMQFLNESEQDLYTQMVQSANGYRTYIKVDASIDEQRLSQMYGYLQADFPQLFWLSGYSYLTNPKGEITGVYFTYTSDQTTAKSQWNQLESALNTASEQLGGVVGDYEKSLWINDFLCGKIEYDENTSNQYTAFGALVECKAVCAGYARAAQLLFMGQGIECLYVRGESRTERHGWNIVKLEGDYYHFDATWNDAGFEGADESLPGADQPSYAYLNVTTDQISVDHTIFEEENYPLPHCESNKLSYFYKNNLVGYNCQDMVQIVADAAVKNFASGQYWVDFMMKPAGLSQEFLDRYMSDTYKHIRLSLGTIPVSYQFSYSNNDQTGVVRLFFRPR